jgi:hypothetical protein
MSRTMRVVTAALILAGASSLAGAQTNTHFSIGAGASFPTGRFGDGYKTGYHVLGAIDFDRPASPIGFRMDGMFNEFEHETFNNADVQIYGLTGNLVVKGSSPRAGPYLIGGIGVYGTKPEGGNSDSDVGFNIGGGLRFELTGFTAFLEARFHQVRDNLRFVPLTFGLTF